MDLLIPLLPERQKAYARALDERMIYTPQFIINGVESSFGGQRAEVASLIQKYAQLLPGRRAFHSADGVFV
jgi:hypothetical protein